jgi:hypothetical protein
MFDGRVRKKKWKDVVGDRETGEVAKFSVKGLPKYTKIGEFSSLYTGQRTNSSFSVMV